MCELRDCFSPILGSLKAYPAGRGFRMRKVRALLSAFQPLSAPRLRVSFLHPLILRRFLQAFVDNLWARQACQLSSTRKHAPCLPSVGVASCSN